MNNKKAIEKLEEAKIYLISPLAINLIAETLALLKEQPEAGEPRIIFLTQGQFTIVDAADYEELSKYKWQAAYSDGWYAKRITSRIDGHKTIWMHRQIMNPSDNMQVDHIKHNTLDNRRCKLRVCTQNENQHNQKPRKLGTSKYKGVSYRKDSGKWHACLRNDGHLLSLGDYNTEELAAEAYNQTAKTLFGEFACLNQIKK